MPRVKASIDLRSKNAFFNSIMSELDELERRAQSAGYEKMSGKRELATDITENVSEQVQKEIKKTKTKYTKERKQLADKVSQMARTANKRLDRLAKNNLEGQSAYAKWYDNGAVRFSVKGKNYQQLQKEYWRVKNFLDSQTSTIKGAKQNMQRVAEKIMGLKAENVAKMSLQELNDITTNFFRIKDTMEDYYEQINNNAKRLDYQKIFTEIQQYFNANELMALGTNTDFDVLVKQMREYFDMEQSLEQQYDLWE